MLKTQTKLTYADYLKTPDDEGSLLRRPPKYNKRRDAGSEAPLRQRNRARTCLPPISQRRRC